ncbi:hypothetical protein JB92DRAFT_1998068 [Gautieria morchelliformis]|nr:hypothetical protein JB92DRAFT_1998068 [Gautieria morchelliformis]
MTPRKDWGRSLSHIPKADKLGLIASSTPFITGRPFTLFYDDRIYSSGAVGVGLRLPRRPTSTVNFHGLVPLSDPMKVSKSEGNLIHGLNHSSPSGMLVKALDADLRMAQKEDKFFLGHLRPGPPGGLEVRGSSRGSIALEADHAPSEGEVVQFFYQVPDGPLAALDTLKLESCHEPSFHFLCSTDDDITPDDDNMSERQPVQVFQNRFLVSSENGFVSIERTTTNTIRKCAIPGAVGSLTWADNKLA